MTKAPSSPPPRSDSDGSSSEGSSDGGALEEPVLKFQRMRSSLDGVFESDAATALAVYETFLCVGLLSGGVYIVDYHGNLISTVAAHSQRVNDLSVDQYGEFVASCSDDGRVVVTALQSAGVEAYDYFRFVKTVTLDPAYGRRRDKVFATGGVSGQLVLNRKGWVGSKDLTLHEGEGTIETSSWRGPLIAWSNDWGVKLYDSEKQQRISFIEKPAGTPENDVCRCRLAWEGEAMLYIGWGSTLMVVAIRERDAEANVVSGGSTSLRYAEIVGQFEITDGVVAGLSPFDSQTLAVLVHVPEEMPELRLLQSSTGEVLSADALPIRGHEHLKAPDYSLESDATGAGGISSWVQREEDDATAMPGGLGAAAAAPPPVDVETLFVLSPKDVIVARRRDADDRISWALEREEFAEAVAIAAAEPRGSLKEHSFQELVELYLQDLMAREEYETAAQLCPQLLGSDAVLWERWVFVFAQKRQLHSIAPFIPTSNPRLSSQQYDMVLEHFLHTDGDAFLQILKTWPRPTSRERGTSEQLYNPAALIEKVKHRLRTDRPPVLLEALSELYSVEKEHANALRILLELQDTATDPARVFRLIGEYQLFDAISDKLLALVRLSKELAGNLLVTHMDRLLVPNVAAQLSGDRALLHWYLHLVFRRRTDAFNVEAYADLHEVQVGLYAEFAPAQDLEYFRENPEAYADYDSDLLRFLRKSNYAPLEAAYKACAARDPPLYQEMVYILGRTGHFREGLKLITDDLQNVTQAIAFVEEHDPELWEVLVAKSLRNTDFMAGLLEHAGSHVQPARLVGQIPHGMVIPDLGNKILTIMSDCRLQLALREGCNRVLETDTLHLLQRLYRTQRRGIPVEPDASCSSLMCGQSLRVTGRNQIQTALVIFACGHSFHEPCLMEMHSEPAEATEDAAQDEGEEPSTRVCLRCSTRS